MSITSNDFNLLETVLRIEPIRFIRIEQFLQKYDSIVQTDKYKGNFLEFSFNIKAYEDWEMSGGILFAFTDLNFLDTFRIPRATMLRFLLCAQQGYRPLPYHNWQHACSVAHFGYLLIKKLRLIENGYLTQLQGFAILVSAIMHDIDHRGTNNRFHSLTNSELYQIYETDESILEIHHLAITKELLKRSDCNLTLNMNSADRKEFLELLKWNILATDISKYISTRMNNFKLLKSFKKGSKEHSFALLSLMMTACDLNDGVKKWDDHLVATVLTEFFEQSEIEKSLGFVPMAIMDKDQAYIPEVEFKFITGISQPIYTVLADKFTELAQCVEVLEKYLDYWESSTLIFTDFKDVENKLDILSMPEMKEENIILLNKKNPHCFFNIRKKPSRGSVARNSLVKAISTMSFTPVATVQFTEKEIANPELEFKKMFVADDDSKTGRSSRKFKCLRKCFAKCFKKNKKSISAMNKSTTTISKFFAHCIAHLQMKCLKEAIKLWEEKTGEKAEDAEKMDLTGWYPPIEKIDSYTSHLPNCQKLSLSTNMIERISNLNPLKCLKILSIGRNYLKSLIGVEACADTLEQIWASYNMIDKPSKGVTSLKKLKVLYLANNTVREWSEIGRLSECPELEEMVLVGNPLEEKYAGNSGEWQREVAKKIPQIKKLDGLTIVHTTETEGESELNANPNTPIS